LGLRHRGRRQHFRGRLARSHGPTFNGQVWEAWVHVVWVTETAAHFSRPRRVGVPRSIQSRVPKYSAHRLLLATFRYFATLSVLFAFLYFATPGRLHNATRANYQSILVATKPCEVTEPVTHSTTESTAVSPRCTCCPLFNGGSLSGTFGVKFGDVRCRALLTSPRARFRALWCDAFHLNEREVLSVPWITSRLHTSTPARCRGPRAGCYGPPSAGPQLV
jgi:hypothetical protein